MVKKLRRKDGSREGEGSFGMKAGVRVKRRGCKGEYRIDECSFL